MAGEPKGTAQIYDATSDEYGSVSDRWSMTKGLPGEVIYQVTAEDFHVTASGGGAITQAQWFGFYEEQGGDCTSGYTDSFTVTYYDSVLHPATGTRVPGGVMATFTAQPMRTLMPQGEWLGNGLPLYVYTLSHSAVTVAGGGCHFIEVRNNGGEASAGGCHWHWAWAADVASPPDWNYSAFWLGPDGTSYEDMGDVFPEKNLAFSLNIQFDRVDPAALCASE